MHLISILFVALIGARGHHPVVVAEPQSQLTSLCALVARPDYYAGKTVKVQATLASGMEFQTLKDDSCPPKVNPESGKSDLVEAKFSENYDFKSPINKKLAKLLKNRKQVSVTMIGVFIDPGKYFGHQLCCRYQLDIQQLVSIEESSKSQQNRHCRRSRQ